MAVGSQEIKVKIDASELEPVYAYVRALEERVMQLEANQLNIEYGVARGQWHGGGNGSFVLECSGCPSRFTIPDPTHGTATPPELAYRAGWILSPGLGWLCLHCYRSTATPWQGEAR